MLFFEIDAVYVCHTYIKNDYEKYSLSIRRRKRRTDIKSSNLYVLCLNTSITIIRFNQILIYLLLGRSNCTIVRLEHAKHTKNGDTLKRLCLGQKCSFLDN